MDQIEQYRQKTIDNLAELDALINKSPLFHSQPQQWKQQVDALTLKTKKKLMELEEEVKELPPSQASHYNGSIQSFKKKMEKLKNDCDKRGRPESMIQAQGAKNQEESKGEIYEVFRRGDEAQEMTKNSVREMNRIVEQGIQMANDINLELNKQIQQLDRMQQSTKDAQSTLKRAQKNIKYFIRAMDCDMCMVGLLMLILLALVGVIVLAVKQNQKSE